MNQLQQFHKELLASAVAAREAGECTVLDCVRVRTLAFRPRALKDVYALAVQELCSHVDFVEAVSHDSAGTFTGEELATSIISGQFKVDWEKLGDFIMKILPAILQIISLFL